MRVATHLLFEITFQEPAGSSNPGLQGRCGTDDRLRGRDRTLGEENAPAGGQAGLKPQLVVAVPEVAR